MRKFISRAVAVAAVVAGVLSGAQAIAEGGNDRKPPVLQLAEGGNDRKPPVLQVVA